MALVNSVLRRDGRGLSALALAAAARALAWGRKIATCGDRGFCSP